MPERITPDTSQPLWYKDAVIYALHVKTFFDGNGDGIGDFDGLIAKLDYLTSLGVTCLWLLPFYASPLRDDGYDISDYERVDSRFGSINDFVHFVKEAHHRGLRIITELVINHTSDQHPWFQAARRSPAGSSARDFYVWSDTDQRFRDARVIFHDVEPSNWTWDPLAGAYYWHRFFRHQPDLNFDNPRVQLAVVGVMQFWFDLGIDGVRLDAVAHLYEREGTTCDNLPETHRFLKYLRAVIDRQYPGRVLLAEANQWPSDTRPYFGDGDECHMAFHFPLMPRLFIALKRQEAFPVIDIVRRTQDLPDTCQWAVFLRNHDELTLSAVTDDERDFLYEEYARDPRMRLNHGIRRRLAPLLDNDRAQIELAKALLLSLPGSPVIYYGDEIGMGDNIQLGDRDGVRTPMQWTSEVHGGFTRDGVRPISPPIEDPQYGYLAVNVADQEARDESLLHAMRRLILIRARHRAFGRGAIEFLECQNSHVLAFVRRYLDEALLVIANLSRSSQLAVIDLRTAEDSALTELVHGVQFPPVGAGPYALTLGPLAYQWFEIVPPSVSTGLPRTGV